MLLNTFFLYLIWIVSFNFIYLQKKNKMAKKYITINVTGKSYSDEIDFSMYGNILGKNVPVNDIHLIGNHRHEIDNYPISIDELKKLLEKIEESGANYVSVEYNAGHPDYVLIGLDVHETTIAELEELKIKNKEIISEVIEAKKAKILKLTEEIEDLKSDL